MKIKTNLVAALACGLLSASALAVPDGWTENFAQAKEQAAAESKDLLLEFTGSDWCPPCQALKAEVFDQPEFSESAPESFVLVKLDFPNQVPQSEEVVAQNQQLQQEYGIEGYPTVILADASGMPYAQTGYRPNGAEAYVKHLDELKENRTARDEAMATAATAEGLDKARALDAALDAVGLDLAQGFYVDTIQQIVDLDPDNEAGLKAKYEQILNARVVEAQMQEAFGMFNAGDFPGGLARLDKIAEDHDLMPDQLQMLRAVQGNVYMQLGDNAKARESMQTAIDVDPDSEIAAQIQQFVTQQLPAASE